MYFLGIGLLLLVCKLLEIDPIVTFEWWIIWTPFGLAALWWTLADASGYSRARAEKAMEKRRQERIERNKTNLNQ